MSTIAQPAWLDTSMYPFSSHTFETPAGKMHYVDEGEGPVILFVHGTPSWSFEYREQIASLSKEFRCIAVDHLGFGLSEKPLGFPGTPEDHAKNLDALINYLGLDSFCLVVHDFGGPIGLSYALDHPEKVRSIIVLNTWLRATADDPNVSKIDRLVSSKIGRFLYLRMNFSPRLLMPKGFHDKSVLTKKIHRHYLAPFPDKHSRHSLLRLAKSLKGSSDWYASLRSKSKTLDGIKMTIIWGSHDPFFDHRELEKLGKLFPHAHINELEAGHFPQEEKSSEVTELIRLNQ